MTIIEHARRFLGAATSAAEAIRRAAVTFSRTEATRGKYYAQATTRCEMEHKASMREHEVHVASEHAKEEYFRTAGAKR